MSAEKSTLIRYRLQRARETLREARALLDQNLMLGSVNRAYYACFYAVTALLLSEGLSSAKHSGVMSLFNRHWVKTGRLPASSATTYNRLFERRQAGDYRDMVSFEPSDVLQWLDDAEAFVREIESWLRNNASIDE